MWMWLLVKISIYHTFITFLLKKLIFWNEKFQISHMISKHGSYYVKWHGSLYLQFSTKNHLNYFWNIFMFLNTHVHCIRFHKYIPISHFIKWNENNFYSNFLPRSYLNIICKNIVKFFQKFEVWYTQTCTSLENSTMWHPKRSYYSVFSPNNIILNLSIENW
jgi:hypothetical protein